MSAVSMQRDARKRQCNAQPLLQEDSLRKIARSAGRQTKGAPLEIQAASISEQNAVILVDKSVRANDARRSCAQQCAKTCRGFTVLSARTVDNCQHPRVTHVVVGGSLLANGTGRAATRKRLGLHLARWPGVRLLDEAWLTLLTSSRSLPPTAGFEVSLDGEAVAVATKVYDMEPGAMAVPSPVAALLRGVPSEGRYSMWLGWWSPELDGLDDVSIMMQAVFNDQRCAAVGNSAIVAGLRELKQYEIAVQESDDAVGTRALAYARAAAAVQACAFRITGRMSEDFLMRHLPFVSASCARSIRQLAESSDGGSGGGGSRAPGGSGTDSDDEDSDSGGGDGDGAVGASEQGRRSKGGGRGGVATCERLELFRRDLPVRDSGGALRMGSEGAASRRGLSKLPGVGPSTAKAWYDKGCRSLADALALMQCGQLRPPAATAWALHHHADLTSPVTASEVEEMAAAVRGALAAASALSAEGWVVQLVGGGRRGRAAHDVDFMISHPAVVAPEDMGQSFEACARRLMEAGHLLSDKGNCTQMQRGKFASYYQSLMRDLAGGTDQDGRRRIMDGLDHIFGVFRTRAGRLARVDLIFCPWPALPHAVLGWSGSSQFLRFLNQYAAARGFRRTNHALYRLETRQPVEGILDEAGIFGALGLPYREPQDRQCP